jgi:ABC-type transporter Mla subunit MlaD
MRKSLQRLEKLTPLIEDTLKEYRDLGKVAREMAPDVRRTVNEFGELAKTVKEAVPDGRRAVEDAAAASRNVGKLAERLDVFVQTNQEKITRAIDQLTDGVQRVTSLFSEENVKTIEATLRNARRASDNFESIAVNVDQATKEAKEALQEGKAAVKEGRESVRRFHGMLDRVDEILKNLQEATRPLAERSPSLLRNADESLEKINRTMGDVNALFRVLDQSDGTFRKFLTDPAIYNRIDDILCGVQRLVPRMDRILRDAETFADKLARHPESLGIGGVVRPGTGLKEPPTPPGQFRGPR